MSCVEQDVVMALFSQISKVLSKGLGILSDLVNPQAFLFNVRRHSQSFHTSVCRTSGLRMRSFFAANVVGGLNDIYDEILTCLDF